MTEHRDEHRRESLPDVIADLYEELPPDDRRELIEWMQRNAATSPAPA